jgi:hypothetical protein
MNRKIITVLAAIPLSIAAGIASAETPAPLSDKQMDQVTAGALSAGAVLLSAAAVGTNALAFTTGATVVTQTPTPIATPLGPYVLQQGAVVSYGISVSSN